MTELDTMRDIGRTIGESAGHMLVSATLADPDNEAPGFKLRNDARWQVTIDMLERCDVSHAELGWSFASREAWLLGALEGLHREIEMAELTACAAGAAN
jgi:hypothetical protein